MGTAAALILIGALFIKTLKYIEVLMKEENSLRPLEIPQEEDDT